MLRIWWNHRNQDSYLRKYCPGTLLPRKVAELGPVPTLRFSIVTARFPRNQISLPLDSLQQAGPEIDLLGTGGHNDHWLNLSDLQFCFLRWSCIC